MSNYGAMSKLFATHIVEVKVVRRNRKVGYGPTRRFLCTNNPLILDSIAGRTAFHYRAPSRPPAYNPRAKNLIFAFDLMMQDYRAVNLNSDVVIDAMPVRNEEEVAKFWDYFNVNLSKWSSSNKEMFKNM